MGIGEGGASGPKSSLGIATARRHPFLHEYKWRVAGQAVIVAYYSGNTPSCSSSIYHKACVFSISLQLWLLCNQAAQLTHLIDGRLREATEDAEREKALKDVAEATTKDQKKAVEVAEKRAQTSEKVGG